MRAQSLPDNCEVIGENPPAILARSEEVPDEVTIVRTLHLQNACSVHVLILSRMTVTAWL